MKRVILIVVFVVSTLAENSRGADAKEQVFPEHLRPQAEAAQRAFKERDYREAASVYSAMRTKAPDNPWVLSNLAVVEMRLERFTQAEETLRAAVKVAPEDGFLRRMLGIACYSQQKYDEAIVELAKAVVIDPKDAEAHLYLAFCAAQKGQSESASTEFALAAELNPDYKPEVTKTIEAHRRWPVGDYLTPLERKRLLMPPLPVIR